MWVDACWVEEAPFIDDGSWHFPRNPNGFYPIWPSLSLPFFPHLFNHPILVKFPLPICIKSGILGAQSPFSRGCLRIPIFSYLLPFLSSFFYGQVWWGKENGCACWFKGWSTLQYPLVIWKFLLETCSSHVLELCNSFSDFPSWLLFLAKCWWFCRCLFYLCGPSRTMDRLIK